MPAASRLIAGLAATLVTFLAAGTLAAQEPAPSPAATPTARADAPLPLPAALYDVLGVWDLGWGDSPGRGRPSPSASVRMTTRVSGGRSTTIPAGITPPQSRFMVDSDSILYRRGSDWAEIALADVINIAEVRYPEANVRGWVEVTWAVRGGEERIYFRQVNASSQASFVATLRRAVALNREKASAR